MRILCLGLDGADHELVSDLLAQGRLPTIARLAREGTFGPLRSTIPAVTPTAWSSFLTGLNPAGHGIFNFTTNANRSTQRIESAASRAGAPFWRKLGEAGIRSAFVGIPFTYPPEPIAGVLVTGYGGPFRPTVLPERAAERVFGEYPDLVTAHHPMAERWWEDFPRYTRRLIEHVEQIGGVCKIAMELEPDLRLLCVDFMSSDFAGHLAYNRLDGTHPAHDPAHAGDELVQVYEAVDRVCGELVEEAGRRYGEEPTVFVISDHGMKPIHWVFHANQWLEEAGLLRFRRRSLQPLLRSRLNYTALVDQRLARTRRRYARALDALPLLPRPRADREFGDVDYGRTLAYCYGTGGQIFLGEASGALHDPGAAREVEQALASITHPETGERAFDVKRKEELYHGPYLHKAPELVLMPRDERIFVESSRRSWPAAFERHERLDPEAFYGYSGHHGLYGIVAAAGPGVSAGSLPENAEITQMPATLLGLLGLSADLDAAPLETTPTEEAVYSADEEAEMVERLRDLGYE